MAAADNVFQEVVAPWLGGILSIFLFLAPLPDVIRSERRGHLGVLNPVPVAAMLANCVPWVVYAIHLKNAYIFIPNVIGVITSTFQLCIMIRVGASKEGTEVLQAHTLEAGTENGAASCTRERPAFRLSVAAWVFCLVIAVYPSLGMSVVFFPTVVSVNTAQLESVLGAWALAQTVLMYGAPLSTLKQVIATKDASSIHLGLSITCFVNGCMWATYGLATDNMFVASPNAVGVVMGVAQFALKMLYKGVGGATPARPVAIEQTSSHM